VSGVMLYLTVEKYVYPIIGDELVEASHPMTLLEVLIRLFPALLATTLLMFILTFECILNILAELSCFADRHFYADWWNSCSYAEFARKWNVPVHRFLRHHLYLEVMRSLRLSKFTASALTFLFSSVFHELVLYVMLGSGPHCYFFFLQMLQIPLI